MLQQRKPQPEEEKAKKAGGSDNPEAKAKAAAGQKLLEQIDEALKPKRGGKWIYCCGIKTWIPD